MWKSECKLQEENFVRRIRHHFTMLTRIKRLLHKAERIGKRNDLWCQMRLYVDLQLHPCQVR